MALFIEILLPATPDFHSRLLSVTIVDGGMQTALLPSYFSFN